MQKQKVKEQFEKELDKMQNVVIKAYENDKKSVDFDLTYDLKPLYHLIDSTYLKIANKMPDNAEKLEDLFTHVVMKKITILPYVKSAFIKNYTLHVSIHKEKNTKLHRLYDALRNADIHCSHYDAYEIEVNTDDYSNDLLFSVNADWKHPDNLTVKVDEQFNNDWAVTELTDKDNIDYFIKALKIVRKYLD